MSGEFFLHLAETEQRFLGSFGAGARFCARIERRDELGIFSALAHRVAPRVGLRGALGGLRDGLRSDHRRAARDLRGRPRIGDERLREAEGAVRITGLERASRLADPLFDGELDR